MWQKVVKVVYNLKTLSLKALNSTLTILQAQSKNLKKKQL